MATIPPELKLSVFGDQSLFVRSAIGGVVRETLIAAFLTGMVILLFLGSWRSTLIVCISIPLSILTSICILSLLGQTINVMTLGGLALAVGILVDDATVEIENTHRNLGMGKPLVRAVLDGASQIAVPTFVSTLVHLHRVRAGAAADRHGAGTCSRRWRWRWCSRCWRRTCCRERWCRPWCTTCCAAEVAVYQAGGHGGKGILWSIHRGVNCLFERLRYRYIGLLDLSLRHRAPVLIGFLAVSFGSLLLVRMVGRDFFPDVDAGTVAAARAQRPGHTNRADRAPLRRRRAGNPQRAARRRNRHDPRQHRHPERLGQPRAGRRAEHRGHRRRDPDFAESRKARAGARVRSPASQAARTSDSPTWCSSSSRPTSPTRF